MANTYAEGLGVWRVKARKHSSKLLLCGLWLSLGFETRKLQPGRGK
jgi:hypothetical protein